MALQHHVSDTAFLVNESRGRMETLSRDRFARSWIPAELREGIRDLWRDFAQEVYAYDDLEVSLRNRFYLDIQEKALLSQGGVVINVGAGLTSYPYLLPRCSFIEVDYPSVSEFKKARAEELRRDGVLPERDVKYISADLNEPASRRRLEGALATEVSARPSCLIMEGVIYYLQQEALSDLFGLCRRIQSPGSILAYDYWVPDIVNTPVFQRQLPFFTKRFAFSRTAYTFTTREAAENVYGYRLVESTDMPELESRYCESTFMRDPQIHLLNPIVVLLRGSDDQREYSASGG